MAEGIGQPAETIAPKHVRWFRRDLGAGADRLLEGRVDIFHVQENAGGRATQSVRRTATAAGHFIRQHDDRVADFEFGMPDLSRRPLHANFLLCSESSLVEVNCAGCIVHGQIGRDRMKPVRNWFYFSWHIRSPFKKTTYTTSLRSRAARGL